MQLFIFRYIYFKTKSSTMNENLSYEHLGCVGEKKMVRVRVKSCATDVVRILYNGCMEGVAYLWKIGKWSGKLYRIGVARSSSLNEHFNGDGNVCVRECVCVKWHVPWGCYAWMCVYVSSKTFFSWAEKLSIDLSPWRCMSRALTNYSLHVSYV